MACEAAFPASMDGRCGYDSYLILPLNRARQSLRAGKVGGIHGVGNIQRT